MTEASSVPVALSGGWNFRDVATSTGAIIPGRLFRSGELTKLDTTGLSQLRAAGITDVADLRSDQEVTRHGADLVPDGVVVHLLPFYEPANVDGAEPSDAQDADSEVAPHESAFTRLMTAATDEAALANLAREYMTDAYVEFARAPRAQQAVHRMITLLGDGAALLTHCFAGKDRTGFTVALILDAVGVDRDTVLTDYLASNAAAPALREQILGRIASRFDGEIPAETMEYTEMRLSDAILGVQPEYLDAALNTLATDFGSTDNYLHAAGVTDRDLTKLRTALLG